MTPASRCTQWNALQGASILILLRLSSFFCSGVPYTAAYAQGILIASLSQAALLLPLLLCTDGSSDPPLLKYALRIYAVLHAAGLTAALCGLHRQEHLPHGILLPLLLTAVLLYTVSRSDSATARAGVLLFCAACAGFLMLPLRWLRFAQPPVLAVQGSPAAWFLQEWQLSGELPMILLLRERQQRRDTLCSTAAWAVCKAAVLPLTVLFSRTKLPMDFVKGAAIGLFLGLIAFLVRQYILSKTDIRNSERIKQIRQDTVLQAFTEDLDREGLTLKAFHNGLSAELNRYFYESEDKSLQTVADYDILDFSEQRIEETADGKQLTVQVQLRVIKASGSHMTSELGWYRITMRMESKDRTVLLHGGLNMIECPNCGAKVNVEQPNCMYCGSPVTFKRLLTLTSIRRIEDPEA